jgi:hypothetical protein
VPALRAQCSACDVGSLGLANPAPCHMCTTASVRGIGTTLNRAKQVLSFPPTTPIPFFATSAQYASSSTPSTAPVQVRRRCSLRCDPCARAPWTGTTSPCWPTGRWVHGIHSTPLHGHACARGIAAYTHTPSGFLVVFEKPNRSSFTFTFTRCLGIYPYCPLPWLCEIVAAYRLLELRCL